MDNTNKNTSAPSLMRSSANNVNSETAKSGMLARLEDPTGQKKVANQKSQNLNLSIKSIRFLVIGISALCISAGVLYFILRSSTNDVEADSPVVSYANEKQSPADLKENVNKLKQASAVVAANEVIIPADSEIPPAPAATIVSEPEAKPNAKNTEPAIENPHDQLSKALLQDNDSASKEKKLENTKKSAEEADASRKLASTLAKIQAEPVEKKQVLNKAEVKTLKSKAEAKPVKKSKPDSDIKVIDALVAEKPANPKDRDVKVLAALVSADNATDNKAQPNTQPHLELEKSLNKQTINQPSGNATAVSKAQAKPEATAQPMTLGNAGGTIADELAQCSELNMIKAPICRIQVCYGHVGKVPECTPEFKKPEVKTDGISVISGH